MQNEIEPFAWVGIVTEDGAEKETVFMKTKKGVEIVIQEKYPEADEVIYTSIMPESCESAMKTLRLKCESELLKY